MKTRTHNEILAFIHNLAKARAEGITNDEVCASSTLTPNRVSPRFGILREQGLLRKTGVFRKTRLGRNAEVHVAA